MCAAAPARRSGRRLVTLVTAAVLCLLALCTVTVDALGIILLQVSGYIVMPLSERAGSQAQYAPSSANAWCMERGGALIADATTDIIGYMLTQTSNSGESLRSTYLDGDATPPEAQSITDMKCVEGVPNKAALSPSSMWCSYRWRFGFYDMFSEVYGPNSALRDLRYSAPGLCYYKGLYFDPDQGNNPIGQFCNGFTLSRIWNSSKAFYMYGYPRGLFRTMAGTTPSSYFRMDTHQTAVENDPNPRSSYYVHCYLQDYPLPALWTTRLPQPAVVKGYKDLTWAQRNWWVIFLIIAAVLLLILIAILIYCTVTSVKPEPKPPVSTMVHRERSGRLYADIEEEDIKRSSHSINSEEPSLAPQPRSALMVPPPLPMPMPPNMPPPVIVDPEDLMQGVPRIFSQDDTMLTGDGDSFIAPETEEDDSDEEGNGHN